MWTVLSLLVSVICGIGEGVGVEGVDGKDVGVDGVTGKGVGVVTGSVTVTGAWLEYIFLVLFQKWQ